MSDSKNLILLLCFLFYGCEKQNLPSISYVETKIVCAQGAVCYFYIDDHGSSEISECGFVWREEYESKYKHSQPMLDNSKNRFTYPISGLKPNTTYFLNAYAKNEMGIGYGTEVQFTTSKTGEFSDVRDGRTYKWVEIGDQIWMGENLAYIPYVHSPLKDSGRIFVYNYFGNSVSEAIALYEYNTYGCLYNWEILNEICPEGWHLPSDGEWRELETFLGMNDHEAASIGYRGTNQGGLLKQSGTAFWEPPNNGALDISGFSALPSGDCKNSYPHFSGITKIAYFLSFQNSSGTPIVRELSSWEFGINRTTRGARIGFSVRCIKNE